MFSFVLQWVPCVYHWPISLCGNGLILLQLHWFHLVWFCLVRIINYLTVYNACKILYHGCKHFISFSQNLFSKQKFKERLTDLTVFLFCADTGCLTISQYILLDPILMFYIMVAVFCVAKFQTHSKRLAYVCHHL